MLYNFLLLFFSIVTRFVGLSWGNGFHFHPDENNMAWAVGRLSWPNLNPEFFAYGQFPLYLTYFSLPKPIIFNQAVLGLRFWSTFFSFITIVVGYFLAKLLFQSRYWARIYSLLLIFTPGLIQTAHFGTTESILIFVSLTLVFLSLKYLQTSNWKLLLLASLVSAIGLASKLNSVLLLLPVILAIFNKKNIFKKLFFYGGLTFVLTLIFSPYYLLEFQEVLRIFKYESSIAWGSNQIFYTRQFIDTTPFWFQMKKIFPWVLGLPMLAMLIISLGVFLSRVTGYLFGKKGLSSRPQWRDLFFKKRDSSIKTRNDRNIIIFLLFAGFFPWFIFNGLLFTKWTRFMTPILPFLVLLVVWGIKELFSSHPEFISGSSSKIIFANFTIPKRVRNDGLLYLVLFLFILPGVLYMKIYLRPDIRVQAMEWMNNNLSPESVILYEGGNVVDLPKMDRTKFETLSLDFYHLEKKQSEQDKLEDYLKQADYYLMPSRRLFANYIRLPNQYPYSADFYKKIFAGDKLTLVKKFTPFSPVGQILLGPDTLAEETWTVFDHPTIRLFKIN